MRECLSEVGERQSGKAPERRGKPQSGWENLYYDYLTFLDPCPAGGISCVERVQGPETRSLPHGVVNSRLPDRSYWCGRVPHCRDVLGQQCLSKRPSPTERPTRGHAPRYGTMILFKR